MCILNSYVSETIAILKNELNFYTKTCLMNIRVQ